MTDAVEGEGEGEAWPDPVPLHPPNPDPLPLGPLPTWLRAQVDSVARATQTPTDLAVMQGLAALSTALANKAKVGVRAGYTEPVHLWTAVVLPPASRKSAVHRHMAGPISTYQADRVGATQEDRQMAEHKREVTEDKLKAAKKEWGDTNDPEVEGEALQEVRKLQERLNEIGEPRPPRLLASDVTAEKLIELMARHHGRIAVLAPEGEIFRLMAGRYRSSGTNFDPHKRAWTGDEPIRDDRIGREGNHVKRPALTLGVCVQPSVFETLEHKRSFRGEGLLARFLYAVPDSRIGSRLTGEDVPDLDRQAAEIYENRLRTLLASEPQEVTAEGEFVPHHLSLTDRARKVAFAFEQEVEDMLDSGGRLDPIQDWGGKLSGQTLRMAGLLHAAEQAEEGHDLWRQPIQASTMQGAVELARALVPHALRFFDAVEQEEDLALARYVLERIRSADDLQTLTERGVHRLCHNKAEIDGVEDLRPILEILENRYWIRFKSQPSEGGRPPSPRIHVHPALGDGTGPWKQDDRSDRKAGREGVRPSSVTSVTPTRKADDPAARRGSRRGRER